MKIVVRQAFALLVLVAVVVGPTGCTTKKEEPSNDPEFKVPEIPPVSRDKDGKKAPEKK